MKIDYYRKAKTLSYGGKRAVSAIKYVVVHYTGNKGDTARNNVDYFATSNTRQAGSNYFVDAHEICQSVDDELVAWAVGGYGIGTMKSKVFNSNSISIELCDFCAYNEAVEVKAIECVRYLLKKYNLKKESVVRHFDVTTKCCPKPYVNDEALWKEFLNKI